MIATLAKRWSRRRISCSDGTLDRSEYAHHGPQHTKLLCGQAIGPSGGGYQTASIAHVGRGDGQRADPAVGGAIPRVNQPTAAATSRRADRRHPGLGSLPGRARVRAADRAVGTSEGRPRLLQQPVEQWKPARQLISGLGRFAGYPEDPARVESDVTEIGLSDEMRRRICAAGAYREGLGRSEVFPPCVEPGLLTAVRMPHRADTARGARLRWSPCVRGGTRAPLDVRHGWSGNRGRPPDRTTRPLGA